MKLLVLILNKTEALEELLETFVDNGIKGATIISYTGMAHAIGDYHDGAFLGTLRKYFHPERQENKTILIALKEEQIKTVLTVIKDVIGDLARPDTGVLFTMPIDFEEGMLL